MRARSSIQSSSLVVVALVLASGCSPDEEPVARVVPEPAAPEPLPNPVPDLPLDPPRALPPAPSGGLLRSVQVVGSRESADIGDVATPVLHRLVYQCSDEVTFAVRVAGDRLEVFPPGISKSYVVLTRVPTESQVRYSAPNADFRANGDLATLRVGRDRYVDCVSNPGATVWGTVQPSASR